jgi:ferredoxin
MLANFHEVLAEQKIPVLFNHKVAKIESLSEGRTQVFCENEQTFIAGKTILAIGKSGNARRLNVAGEDLPHVFTKLFDPQDYQNKKILVVGGGDNAVESALLLSEAGNQVTLSYRKGELTRPKVDNVIKFNDAVAAGKITTMLGSQVREIRDGEVDLEINEAQQTEKFDVVFIMIGRELPYEFFAKSGIKIENAQTPMTYWWMAFTLAFANIIYFGKASGGLSGHASVEMAIQNIFTGNFEAILFKAVSWVSVIVFILTGARVLFDLIKNWGNYFRDKWAYIKNIYFAFVMILFLVSFFGNKYFDLNLGQRDPYFWYSFLYTATILLFGIRRIVVTKRRYVTLQTTLLFSIQAIPLFVIPNFVLPALHSAGHISPWVYETVFLGGEWWRFVGFILAWPLFIWNIFTNEPSIFWLVVSLIQTFVIIPFLVIKWGKGAYCSWICSCGAMAETLGDEYRTLAWHGPRAKKWENLGQVILFSIFTIAILHILGWHPSLSGALAGLNAMLLSGYKIIVDTLLAGTIGVGLYFFYSGRVWCRFACPLAALMHIYNKFSSWRILADKKKCISCGLCTKNCHMGIDVMNYANKGKPLDDVECVNCSACVNVCPTGVLSFGRYKKVWKKQK